MLGITTKGKIMDYEDKNALAWLVELIHETSKYESNDKQDMETRLMKIRSYAYLADKLTDGL